MSSKAQRTTTSITALRVTYTTSTPFPTVETRLRDSIERGPSNWPTISRTASQAEYPSQAAKTAHFASLVTSQLGPHAFMKFFELDHGRWLSSFYPATVAKRTARDDDDNNDDDDTSSLRLKRFVLGNPLFAITMLQHDLDAGLYVPLELLLVEEQSGGCRCVYQLPSGLIAGYEGASEELKRAAEALDGKLEALVSDIMT